MEHLEILKDNWKEKIPQKFEIKFKPDTSPVANDLINCAYMMEPP